MEKGTKQFRLISYRWGLVFVDSDSFKDAENYMNKMNDGYQWNVIDHIFVLVSCYDVNAKTLKFEANGTCFEVFADELPLVLEKFSRATEYRKIPGHFIFRSSFRYKVLVSKKTRDAAIEKLKELIGRH